MEVRTKSENETVKYGEKIGRNLRNGKIFALDGELGSGKTTFVKGLARGLGIKKRIISPTFVLLRSYKGRKFNLHHIDLYRLNSVAEISDLGIMDLLEDPGNVIAIEWAGKMESLLPKKTLRIRFDYITDGERRIKIDEG